MFRIVLLSYCVISWFSSVAISQEIEFTVSTEKNSYAINEKIQVNFLLNAEGLDFEAPEFIGFEKLGGLSTSNSMTFENGEKTASMRLGQTLKPIRSGVFIIAPASITVEGKVLHTDSFRITVTADRIEVNRNSAGFVADEDGLFARVELSKEKGGIEDLIIAKYMLYSTYSRVNSIEYFHTPVPNDMWVDELRDDAVLLEKAKKVIDGKSYNAYLLKTDIFQPLRSGSLVIEPFEVSVEVHQLMKRDSASQKSMFDAFFGKHVDTVLTVSSEPLTIEISGNPHTEGNVVSRTDILNLIKADAVDRKTVPGNNIVFAVDVSLSMWCKDIAPDRISAVRSFLNTFIKQDKESMMGLLPFAENYVADRTMTIDRTVLKREIDSLEYDDQLNGTSIGMAIYRSVKMLKDRSGNKSIVLFTDGRNNTGNVSPITAALLAKKYHIRIFVLGIGADGDVLCLQDVLDKTAFENRSSSVNEQLLQAITTQTNGKFYRIRDKVGLKKTLDMLSTDVNLTQ